MTNEKSDTLNQYYAVGASRNSCKLTAGSEEALSRRLKVGGYRKMKQLKKYIVGTLALVVLLAFAVASASPARGQYKINLTSTELKELIKNAKEPADHRKIAQYFNQEADRLEAEAKDHVDLAAIYRANPTLDESKHPMSGRTAGHCDYFSKVAREAARADRQIASVHEAMAKTAKK